MTGRMSSNGNTGVVGKLIGSFRQSLGASAVSSVASRVWTVDSIMRCVLGVELVWCVACIVLERTYSFDWDAYMEEVDGPLNGEFDYSKLRGDTGALVYPAGFVWIYAVFKQMFNWNHLIETTEYEPKLDVDDPTGRYANRTVRPTLKLLAIQLLFTAIYLVFMKVVFEVYRAAAATSVEAGGGMQRGKSFRSTTTAAASSSYCSVPVYVLLLLAGSRRMHSIFVLGFFNDSIAMLALYISVWCFISDRWAIGCIAYSLGVSIKMNVLLFAPGLLCLLLLRFRFDRARNRSGAAFAVCVRLAICAGVQLVLAAPFLLVAPREYLTGAFDLSRVFTLKWSVNWRFVPDQIFTAKVFGVVLLVSTIVGWAYLARNRWWRAGCAILKRTEETPFTVNDTTSNLPAAFIIEVLFASNFVGILFSRTLHYQFLAWYYHTIPYLLWLPTTATTAGSASASSSASSLSTALRIALPIVLEVAWNSHPPEGWSAAVVQCVHWVVAIRYFLYRTPQAIASSN